MPDIGILGEHPLGPALLLWNVVRDLMQWATCPVEARVELFPPETARVRASELETGCFPADVSTWLELLMGVIYGLSDVPRPGLLSDVCERLAGWAGRHGGTETALGFAQGAALAEPMDPRAASLVGELAGRFGKDARAESWYQRAVGIARRRRDWRVYASSYLGMGNVALRRGAVGDAADRFRRGFAAARRSGFRAEQAEGCIGMLRVAVQLGRFDEAVRWEGRARRLVRRNPDKLRELAAASVDLWMHTGDYKRALDGLETLRLDATGREERMYVLARIAHAAAGSGDVDQLSEAWPQAWDLAESTVTASRNVRYRSMIELHRAAALSLDPARAARALNAAAALAGPADLEEIGQFRSAGAGRSGSRASGSAAEPEVLPEPRAAGEIRSARRND